MGEPMVPADTAIALAFTAHDAALRSVKAEPQRMRLQAAPGVPVDVVVGGEITGPILRRIARLLIANAEVLEEPEQPTTSPAIGDDQTQAREGGEADRSLSNPPAPSKEGE